MKFLLENMKGKDHLENLNVDGWIILKLILREIGFEGVSFVFLVQDRAT
jgi:hypothetical protein